MTTLSNFCLLSTSVSGTSSQVLIASPPAQAVIFGGIVDVTATNLSKQNLAKNSAVYLSLSASTPVTLDLTSLATGTTSNAGDTVFALVNQVILVNLGTTPVIVGPGASNGWSGPLGGTSPTYTLPAGSNATWGDVAGWAVSGSVKTVEFNPGSSAAQVVMCVGGS